MSTSFRLYVLIAALLSTAVALRALPAAEALVSRRPLYMFPTEIGPWKGFDLRLGAETLNVLGVDDYLNRAYSRADGAQLWLYIGYYRSQRHGDAIHSPKNCLPGSGWQPVESGRIELAFGGNKIEANRYLVAKGLDRQLVLYWYQSNGRIVASEYWCKFYLLVDAVTRNRTDGSLVRISMPVASSQEAAMEQAAGFIGLMLPLLSEFIPN